MTQKQEDMVQRIRRYIIENDLFHNDPAYEFKEFTVEEMDCGIVRVYSVVGLKNDEGTFASIYCRDRRHIFIGKRGGLTAYKWNDRKKDSIKLHGWINAMVRGCEH